MNFKLPLAGDTHNHVVLHFTQASTFAEHRESLAIRIILHLLIYSLTLIVKNYHLPSVVSILKVPLADGTLASCAPHPVQMGYNEHVSPALEASREFPRPIPLAAKQPIALMLQAPSSRNRPEVQAARWSRLLLQTVQLSHNRKGPVLLSTALPCSKARP